MMSAFECYENAARCERNSQDTDNEPNRRMLLDAAKIWRQLGAASGAAENSMYGPRCSPPSPEAA
jgi:hypothetical protein